MENIINFKKEIKFDTMIYEITEINLDFDYEVNDYTINGSYLVNGYYRDSEIKIGTEAFNFKIPFSIELNNEVILDTVKLEINDFDYQINNNILVLNINNIIIYDETPVIDKPLFEEDEIREELVEESIEPDINDDNIIEENKFVKYQIHIVKENESIVDIANKYGISSNVILSINNDDIKPGCKLIIPNEE